LYSIVITGLPVLSNLNDSFEFEIRSGYLDISANDFYPKDVRDGWHFVVDAPDVT
jgi:hypothetical protein